MNYYKTSFINEREVVCYSVKSTLRATEQSVWQFARKTDISKVLNATAEDVRAVFDYGPELRDGFYERLHRNVGQNS